MDVVASLGNDMKKPVPVKIVEVLGWVYVALSFLAVISVIVLVFKKPSEWPSVIFAVTPVLLTVGMVMSLRRGRRAWFLWPNAFLSYVVVMIVVSSLRPTLLGLLLSLVLIVAPIALLYLKSAKQWFNEMSGNKASSRLGCTGIFCATAFGILVLPLIIDMVVSARMSLFYSKMNAYAVFGRDLRRHLDMNRQSRKEEQSWVDPASCTNSTQFVRALFEKAGEEWNYPDSCSEIWNIAVNPPDDDSFPLLITSNLNPCDLLFKKNVECVLVLTCPKSWGGTCFEFCEKAAVVVHQGGEARLVKRKYAHPRIFFPNGVPKPRPDTYYLTPTGRIDLVSPEQEKTLKAHFKENKGRTLP